eukprot:1175469-Amphidinium_carterae.1
MRLLLTISTVKGYAVYTTDGASAFLNTPTEEEVFVQPPKEFYHNKPTTLWAMKKALYGLMTSPKQWQERSSTILKEVGFNRLKSDACIFGNAKTNAYLMAYVDDLLVVGKIVNGEAFLGAIKGASWGQATIESLHIKQVIEEMAIPEMDTDNVTMTINTDSSSGKAVASRLGLNRKSKHVQLRFLYIQDVIQRGELTIKKIPTTHDPAD